MNLQPKLLKAFLNFSYLLIALSIQGCNGGTITGNPIVNLKFTTFNALTKMDTTQATTAFQPMTIQSLTFCFKRLRFKVAGEPTNADPTLDEDNVDFDLGEVTIDPAGTDLGTLQVPVGTYDRIEFDLEDHCTSNLSVQVDNGQMGGPFSTNSRVTIKFEGALSVTSSTTEINMGIQAITSALNTVTNNSQIKTAAESVSGTL